MVRVRIAVRLPSMHTSPRRKASPIVMSWPSCVVVEFCTSELATIEGISIGCILVMTNGSGIGRFADPRDPAVWSAGGSPPPWRWQAVRIFFKCWWTGSAHGPLGSARLVCGTCPVHRPFHHTPRPATFLAWLGHLV